MSLYYSRQKFYFTDNNSFLQSESHGQYTQSSANLFESANPEIQHIDNDKLTEFQKMFDLFEGIEEVMKPYPANSSERIDFEIMKKIPHAA